MIIEVIILRRRVTSTTYIRYVICCIEVNDAWTKGKKIIVRRSVTSTTHIRYVICCIEVNDPWMYIDVHCHQCNVK